MWQTIKALLTGRDEAGGDETGRAPATGATARVVFTRFRTYPNLFSFNVEKLDINLLAYPDGGAGADSDAVLLLVYACEEILRLDDANEAYICRKLGETRDRSHGVGKGSFDAVYARTAAFDAQRIVDACVARGDLMRVSSVAGGGIRLTDQARGPVEDMAYDLDRGAGR